MKPRGQVAVGLAFAFTTVLAIFSLVLQSSLMTREKMKLQQTTDFAALAAAREQYHSLNQIREINQAIEDSYGRLLEALAALSMPCMTFIAPPCSFVEACVVGATSPFSGRKDRSDTSRGDACDKGCGAFDAYIHDGLIAAYESIQSQHVASAVEIISRTNGIAFEQALKTFLNPANLPVGLNITLQTRYGQNLDYTMLRTEYDRGALAESYDVVSGNAQIPLFMAKVEARTIPLLKWHYREYPNPYGVNLCGLSSSEPRAVLSSAKVVRTGDYTTSFVTGANYAPPMSPVIKKFQLFLKGQVQNKEDLLHDLRGEDLTTPGGEKTPLFRERARMMSLAVAKPYGGSFPEAGSPVDPSNRGDVGRRFTGVKLIGLADTAELGGFRLPLDGEFQENDAQGAALQTHKFYTEDYLH